MALEITLILAGTAAAIYLIRKLRELSWGWVRNKSSLRGKTYIVTGANTGLGFETTSHLVKRGATVILACRSEERANEAIKKIQSKTSEGQMIYLELDLASMNSIRTFAQIILLEYPVFDCLINNAGLAISGSNIKYTNEHYEIHMGVNHLGHFLLYNILKDQIRQNNSRVVVVSSKMHERGKIDFDKFCKYENTIPSGRSNPYYNNSKLANFYFARELYKSGIDCHVLCPGLCHTDFFRDYNPRWYHYILLSPVVWLMLRSAKQGAQNIIHCATDNQNTHDQNPATGYYIRSLRQVKSKIKFNEETSTKLWDESLKLCNIVSEI